MKKKLLISTSLIILVIVLSLSLVACASPQEKVEKNISKLDITYSVRTMSFDEAQEFSTGAIRGYVVKNNRISSDLAVVLIYKTETDASIAHKNFVINALESGGSSYNCSFYENVLVLGNSQAYTEVIDVCKLD